MQTALNILYAIIVFGVIIFVHELGHFLSAKWSGVKVNEFALGMGPALLKFKGKVTQYSLRLFPIGGYCKMEGEDDDSNDKDAFNTKPVWKRIIVIVAGAFMNFVLGFIILLFIFGGNKSQATTIVNSFSKNATSSITGTNGGLKVGDKFVKINGSSINNDTDIIFSLMRATSGKVNIIVLRSGKETELDNVQFPMTKNPDGTKTMTNDFYVKSVKTTPLNVITHSFTFTVSVVKIVWLSLVDLITGKIGFNQLSGPVGVTTAIGQAAGIGLQSLLLLVVFITVNLGVVNLLPLPALDGGRLIFLIIEAIRRKPVDPKYEGYVHFAGFVLLILLMVVITFNDVIKLIK
jgi:regulator of sigma E protease